jgi:hypothetical protein
MTLEPRYVNKGRVIYCPYSQKEDAKALGAQWDPDKKTWYIPYSIKDHEPFKKWIDVILLENVPPNYTNAMRKLGASWSYILFQWFITSDADQSLLQDFLPANEGEIDESVIKMDDGMEDFIDYDDDYYQEEEGYNSTYSEGTAEFTSGNESSESDEDDVIEEVVMPSVPPQNAPDPAELQARLLAERKIRSLFDSDKERNANICCPECSLLPKFCACVPSSEDEELHPTQSNSGTHESLESEGEEDQDVVLTSGRKRRGARILDESSSSGEDSDEPFAFRRTARSRLKRIRPNTILESGDELGTSTPKRRGVREPLSPPPSHRKPHGSTRRTRSNQA